MELYCDLEISILI